MSSDEFQQLWKQYDEKLQRSLRVNQQLLESIQHRKVRVSFGWQIAFKLMVVGLGIGCNVVLGSLLWHFHDNPVFVVAAGLIIGFMSFAVAGYFMQFLLMVSINMSKNILDTQKQLAGLEAIIVRTLRVSFLQAPVWPFLFVPRVLPAATATRYWVIEAVVTILLAAVAIWLYRRITVRNAAGGWVKKMVDNEGGKSIARARAFIKEVEEYRRDETPARP
ncbi:hypothetical protein ACQ86N_48570 [Puia sp. P3]|uniref:hypothetical protein n=1 Tax=Puia sp. P3 TaxID=3423952 RepID=UPI003D66C72D